MSDTGYLFRRFGSKSTKGSFLVCTPVYSLYREDRYNHLHSKEFIDINSKPCAQTALNIIPNGNYIPLSLLCVGLHRLTDAKLIEKRRIK